MRNGLVRCVGRRDGVRVIWASHPHAAPLSRLISNLWASSRIFRETDFSRQLFPTCLDRLVETTSTSDGCWRRCDPYFVVAVLQNGTPMRVCECSTTCKRCWKLTRSSSGRSLLATLALLILLAYRLPTLCITAPEPLSDAHGYSIRHACHQTPTETPADSRPTTCAGLLEANTRTN